MNFTKWLRFTLLVMAIPVGLLTAQSAGPMVGQVSADDARFLYRPGAVEKTFRQSVFAPGGEVAGTSQATSLPVNDYVARFHVVGLQAGTLYHYQLDEILEGGSTTPVAGPNEAYRFRTFLQVGAPGAVTAAFVSGAKEISDPVWAKMDDLGIDQLYLMGDTPYINSSDLAVIRQKHRDLLNWPALAALARHTPVVGTWDDHDFGINNSNGASFAAGKPNTRRGFIEYRAHDQYGTGTEGVFSKVNHGVMEVFLLDPRWFSQTTASPVDPLQTTCFGSAQWDWLLGALRASRATFKVLAMGQIWQDKKNSETDDMFTYWYERDALLDFIRDEEIPGVVLLGGDIHVSRHLIHRQRIGYDLHDFITSPAHTGVIPSLDVYHPDLEWSLVEGRQFLTLTADTRIQPPRLTARYMLHDGSLEREVVIPYDQLVPRSADDLDRDLRARWSFDGTFLNQSVLGSRIDATPVNGVTLVPDGGVHGGAASFARGSSQYLHVPRSILNDNSAAHSVSLWCKSATLPAHGSDERHFLLESTAAGSIATTPGYSLSLGFRTSVTDPTKVNLELHTHTLEPATAVGLAPTAISQGAFTTDLDRSLFLDTWTHVAFTFDSRILHLFVDGTPVAEHLLPIPGPASESGGLVIGGHCNGTGRNYDGLIDEVALWSRVLEDSEIASLHESDAPPALVQAGANR